MRHILLALGLLSCCPQAPPPPAAAAKADRKFTADDSMRFLVDAVFEGLHADWPDAELFPPILKDRDRHFVVKCPNCYGVTSGIEAFQSLREKHYYPYKGLGFPPEIAAGLKNEDRAVRLKAIEAMVDRYVTRHFEQVVMTDGEKASIKSWLIMGKKFGMQVKEKEFGDFCPSCAGATKK